MKTILAILAFSLVLSCNLAAGELLIKGFYGKCFHLAKETESNQNIPEEFQYEQKIPGIGQFYDNGNSFSFGLTYHFNNIKNSKAFALLNFNYEGQSIISKYTEIDEVFGNKLNISMLAFTMGIGVKFQDNDRSARLYFNCGPLINYVNGKTEKNNLRSEFDFGTSLLFRFMTGVDIPIINSDQGISLSISYDLGDFERGKVNYYKDSNWIARAKPTGSANINDDRIGIMFGFFVKIL